MFISNFVLIVLKIHIVAIELIEGRLKRYLEDQDLSVIEVFDLTYSTTWQDLTDYYGAIENRWKICVNCGIPGLGTAIHLEHTGSAGSVQPAVIPVEYLLTRLTIIDVSYLAKVDPDVSLSLEVALQWMALKHDPKEPTLILFKFGWQRSGSRKRQCVCRIPGLSYELAEWIAMNLTHVVGVATDTPTLESYQTRELTTRTISNLLGKSGLYIIENVKMTRRVPERGCMTLAMPLKLLEASYVPTRLTAFCPTHNTDRQVTLALRKQAHSTQINKSRVYDVSLNEILN